MAATKEVKDQLHRKGQKPDQQQQAAGQRQAAEQQAQANESADQQDEDVRENPKQPPADWSGAARRREEAEEREDDTTKWHAASENPPDRGWYEVRYKDDIGESTEGERWYWHEGVQLWSPDGKFRSARGQERAQERWPELQKSFQWRALTQPDPVQTPPQFETRGA